MADAAARAQHAAQQFVLAHPCAHRDPAFGTRVETRVGELSSDDCYDLFACVESWFQRWGAQLPLPATPLFRVDPHTGHVLAHVCDANCPWLIHNTVYYCCWSGAFHNCTAEACAYTDAAPTAAPAARNKASRLYHMEPVVLPVRDKRACRITGHVFDLAFGLSFEQAGFQQSDHRRATRVKEGPPSAHAASKWARRHGAGGDALCVMSSSPEPSPSPTPSPPPPPPPTSRADSFQLTTIKAIEEKLLVIAGYINIFMRPPGLDTETCRTLAAEILNTGEKMAQIAALRHVPIPLGYNAKAHVMTLLHSMATGCEAAFGRTFLPFRVELVGKMLPLEECIRLTGKRNRSKQHTEWSTLLGTVARAYCADPPPTPTTPAVTPMPMLQLRPRRDDDAVTVRPYRQPALASSYQEGSAWLQSLSHQPLPPPQEWPRLVQSES